MRAPLLAWGLMLLAPAAGAASLGAEAAAALEPVLATRREELELYTLDEPTGFVVWGERLGTTERIACAEHVALGVEVAGTLRGAVWVGTCRPDELPGDLLAQVAARGAQAAADREYAPLIGGGRAAVAHRELPGGIGVDEFTVLVPRNGTSVMRTVLIAPPGGAERHVFQYEALRACAANDAPLCRTPRESVDAVAVELVARLARR